jgi:tripartite-type tricarboxylate transporter receptor subunit TctC
VLPYAAGGINDLALRVAASELEARWKQAVIVEPRPGAAGRLAYEGVAKAAPDGYTLVNVVSSLTTMPYLLKDLGFDPQRDLVAVSNFIKYAPLIAISSPTPAQNLQEFVAYAKANPGKLNYATQGRGNYQHLLFEIFKAAYGIDVVPIHYSGSPQVIEAQQRNDVQLFSTTESLYQQAKGRIRLIATTNDTRLKEHPELPTLRETGRFEFVPYSWVGLAAPAGTPRDVLEKIAADLVAVTRNPEVTAKILKITSATGVVAGTPDEFSRLLRDEFRNWGIWIKRLGIEAQ